ncbi:MAG: hypothetical protein GY928_05310, partial [Colwellia sp.]|nr:hypothetical protein [Colwellia sp.]
YVPRRRGLIDPDPADFIIHPIYASTKLVTQIPRGIKYLLGLVRGGKNASKGVTKFQNHHWWPKELGGATKGSTVGVPSANPNLHTKMGGIHPEMRKFLSDQLGVDKWKQAKSEWYKLDFNTQKGLLKDFYETQGMKIPNMKAPGIIE